MSQEPRPDAVNTNVGLLSDEDLYQIYLKALGFPKSLLPDGAKEAFDNSRTKRLLTFADAIIYFMVASSLMLTTDAGLLFGIFLGMLGILSVLNVISGVCAFGGYAYYRNLADQTVAPPDISTLRLHSPEVLSFVADYLTRPLLDNSRIMIRQLHGEREAIERFIGQANEIVSSLRSENTGLVDDKLKTSYEQRITEANETIQLLEKKRNDIWERIHRIEAETNPIEKQVKELETLAHAGKNLKRIQGLTGEIAARADENDEAALDNFASLSGRVEMARENLSELNSGVKAYEQAVEEVNKLRLND